MTRIGLRGHTARVNRVRYTADGKYIVSVSHDGTARVWNDRGAVIATFLHGGFLFSLAMHPQQKQFASGSWDGTIKLWPLTRFALEHSIPYEVGVDPFYYAFQSTIMSDRKHAAVATKTGGLLVDLTTGKQHAIPMAGPSPRVRINATGDVVGFGEPTGAIQLYTSDGTKLGTIPAATTAPAIFEVSPDGKEIAIVENETTLAIWNVSGTKLRSVDVAPIEDVNWLRGTLAVLVSGKEVISGQSSRDLIPFAPDTLARGETVIGARAWEVSSRGAFAVLVGSVVHVYDRGNEEQTLTHPSPVWRMAWTPSGDRLIVGGRNGRVYVWSSDGKLLEDFAAHEVTISFVAVDASEHKLLTTGNDGVLKVWDLADYTQLDVSRTTFEFMPTAQFALDDAAIVVQTRGFLDVLGTRSYDDTAGALARALTCKLGKALVDGRPISRPPQCP